MSENKLRGLLAEALAALDTFADVAPAVSLRADIRAALAAAPAQAVPASGEPSEAPHAELRKAWREGQRWQTRGSPTGQWLDTTPHWHADQEYRRHPNDATVIAAPTQAQVDERSDTVWISIRLGQKNIQRAITLLEIDSMRAPELAFGPLLLKAIAELRKT